MVGATKDVPQKIKLDKGELILQNVTCLNNVNHDKKMHLFLIIYPFARDVKAALFGGQNEKISPS